MTVTVCVVGDLIDVADGKTAVTFMDATADVVATARLPEALSVFAAVLASLRPAGRAFRRDETLRFAAAEHETRGPTCRQAARRRDP